MRDGWVIAKLSEVADRKNAKNSDGIDLVFTVSAQKGLIAQEEYFTKRVASSNLTNYFVVQPGDYVFNKSYSVDAPFGVIAKNSGTNPGLVSPIYIVFGAKAEIIDQDFLGLALSSSIFWGSLEGSLKEGGRGHGALNLKVADFFETLLPLPPLPEQKRVVDLISTVDSYIEAVRQQLERAKVSRNAVLHELLTARGDDWAETTLGDVVELGKGGSWGQDSAADFLTEVVCLRGTDLADLIERKIPTAPTRWVKESELKKSRCQPNMVLIETSGSKCGRSIVLTEEILGRFPLPVIYSNFCRTLEIATETVSNRYIEVWFSHNYQNGLIPSYRAYSAMPNLDVKALLRVESIPIPPLPEQKRIVDLTSSVDSCIYALEDLITSSMSLRSGLLSDLLDGNHEIPASYDRLIGAA